MLLSLVHVRRSVDEKPSAEVQADFTARMRNLESCLESLSSVDAALDLAKKKVKGLLQTVKTQTVQLQENISALASSYRAVK